MSNEIKKKMLKRVKDIYEGGENIIKFLRNNNENSIEDILISYDFQAGTYTEGFYKKPEFTICVCNELLQYFQKLDGKKKSILEAGVGDGIVIVNIAKMLSSEIEWLGGCDLSWSRIKEAQLLAEKELDDKKNIDLFVGDMSQLPLLDNSIDIVYTRHALEPNGGNERILLEELYRVAREWLVLIEPSYEMATYEQRARMDENGYIKGLPLIIQDLGYDLFIYEKFKYDANPLNPAAITIIKKKVEGSTNETTNTPFADPITHANLSSYGDVYYSEDSMLAYPVVSGVPCLMEENAIVATKFLKYKDYHQPV